MTLNLKISLSRWIIEDGNYDDFCVGERRKFALEFWAPTPLKKSAENVMALREQSGHSYDVVGKLVFTSDGVWVIDCGVLAYSEGKSEIEIGCKVGDFVQGNLRFGIDPFFYFELHTSAESWPGDGKTLYGFVEQQNVNCCSRFSYLHFNPRCRSSNAKLRFVYVPQL